ncbi:hypothetical protein Bca4012_056243 [Brassica carinata]
MQEFLCGVDCVISVSEKILPARSMDLDLWFFLHKSLEVNWFLQCHLGSSSMISSNWIMLVAPLVIWSSIMSYALLFFNKVRLCDYAQSNLSLPDRFYLVFIVLSCIFKSFSV